MTVRTGNFRFTTEEMPKCCKKLILTFKIKSSSPVSFHKRKRRSTLDDYLRPHIIPNRTATIWKTASMMKTKACFPLSDPVATVRSIRAKIITPGRIQMTNKLFLPQSSLKLKPFNFYQLKTPTFRCLKRMTLHLATALLRNRIWRENTTESWILKTKLIHSIWRNNQ